MTGGMRGPFAGVVFDLDGVVADTEHLWDASWRTYADSRAATWSHEQSVALQGLSVPEWSARLAEQVGGNAEQAATFCISFIIGEVEGGDDNLMPGAEELISAAAQRVPIALATSSARPIFEVLLARRGLQDAFGATVSSAEVPRGKPSPDVYLEATERIGVAPRAAVGIEDSANGIRAVHAAGMYAIAIPNQQFPPAADVLALADYVATDHADARTHLMTLLP